MQKGSAFDRRIAFVSVDNAVELVFQAYLSMPKRTRGAPGVSPEEYAAIEESFRGLLDACLLLRPDAFSEASPLAIEHYHRIRNTLYHDGTGLTVSENYLVAYFGMAKGLLRALLRVEFRPGVDRLANLRPEVRAELRQRVEQLRKQQHGAAVKAGLVPARAAGRLRGKGGRVSGPSPEEAELAKELYLKNWGYKRISDELTKRRMVKGEPKAPDGTIYAVEYQKVRRKLIEMGVVKPLGEPGYL